MPIYFSTETGLIATIELVLKVYIRLQTMSFSHFVLG